MGLAVLGAVGVPVGYPVIGFAVVGLMVRGGLLGFAVGVSVEGDAALPFMLNIFVINKLHNISWLLFSVHKYKCQIKKDGKKYTKSSSIQVV